MAYGKYKQRKSWTNRIQSSLGLSPSQTPTTLIMRPQLGPQTMFMQTAADIAIYGGAAFGGKTHSLIMEPLRHIHVPGFGAVIFRRTATQITQEGGLWDAMMEIYPKFKAIPRGNAMDWTFPSGASITCVHMQLEQDRIKFDGSQIPLIMFDQLEHFLASQFFYMLSRNRSMCGVKPYIRASANPNPDCFLVDFLSWWIDSKTGYPIPERAGVLRWMLRIGGEIVWGDSKQEMMEKYKPEEPPLSVTFIPASPYDNKIGMMKDPGYVARLRALPPVEQERLLGGNWKIRPSAGLVFKRDSFGLVEHPPQSMPMVRYWDFAATEDVGNPSADFTAGVLVGRYSNNRYLILHVVRFRLPPHEVEKRVVQQARLDGEHVQIVVEEEPGASGKAYVSHMRRNILNEFAMRSDKSRINKLTRISMLASKVSAGDVDVLTGSEWASMFLDEAENFPDGRWDDMLDAASGAVRFLSQHAPLPEGSVLGTLDAIDQHSQSMSEVERGWHGDVGFSGGRGPTSATDGFM